MMLFLASNITSFLKKDEKMKRPETILREYVRRLSDDDVRSLTEQLSQKLQSDRAHAAAILSRDRDVDRWLGSAASADEWFDMMDTVQTFVEQEHSRRAAEKESRKNI